MFTNIDAVIFDLDGTLVDSMWMWKAIDEEYLGEYNLILPKDLQKEIEGMSFTETAQYFKKRFKISKSIEEIKEEWNVLAHEYYANKVPLKQGASDLLEYLCYNGMKMGIGTSNSKELLDVVVKKYNLSKYITSIKTSCEVKRGKPFPDIFLKVAEELEVEPEKCLVFEDIPNGIKAAKNAGMKVCAVYDDFSKDMHEEKIVLADYFIYSFEELLIKKEEII